MPFRNLHIHQNKLAQWVKLETGNYSTVVDLTDVEEGSTIIFKNSASIPGHDDTAEYTTEKRRSVEKFAAVPNGEDITAGNYQQNITADYDAENGMIWYCVVYRTSAGENEELTLTDTIPEGMKYVENSLTARYTSEGFYWKSSTMNFNGYVYNIAKQAEDNCTYDTETNTLTVKIPAGYNGTDSEGNALKEFSETPKILAIYYKLQYTDDAQWQDIMTSQVQYENSVTIGNHPSSSSTTTVNREEKDVIQKSSEQMTIEQGGQEYWVDSFKYYVVINPDARDLEPNLDYLTLTDTITSDTVNRLTLDLGETHLYELDPTKEADHYIGSEVDKDRYNLTYDYTTNTMEVRIPDSFACVLVYTYHVDRGTFGESTLTNTVDLMGRWSDQQDDKVEVNGAVAGVSREGRLTIYKVDGDDYNKRLPGATFTLTEYDREAEGDQKWIVPAVTEKNKQLEKWDDNVFTTDENGTITFTGTKNDPTLDRLTVYRMNETGKPEGYENATPVTFYFVLLGDGIEKVGDIEYNTSTKEGAIQYMEANGKIIGDEPFLDNISFFGNDAYTDVYLENTNNSLTVKKIWQDSNGEEIRGTNPVELEIYGATLGQDGCKITFKSTDQDGAVYTVDNKKRTWSGVLQKGTTVHVILEDSKPDDYSLYINESPENVDFSLVNGMIEFDFQVPDSQEAIIEVKTDYSGWSGAISEFTGVTANHVYVPDESPTYKITLGADNEQLLDDGKIISTKAWSYTINNIQSPGEDKFWIVKEVTTGNWTTVYQNNQSQTGEIKVYNQLTEQYELPETGGIGTKVYIAGGAILMTSSCLLGGYRMRRKRERRRR